MLLMPYSHLLVPSDGSELSSRAIDHAVNLAAALGARITFLHVVANTPIPLIGLGERLDVQTMELLIAASHQESDRILDQASLADVALEFNRYSTRQLLVDETAARSPA